MKFDNIYFLGIGGIGMSALARYFLREGKRVAGYDRTPSLLTGELEAEGAAIHYEDDVRRIPGPFRDPAATMVVYTPAVPDDLGEFRYFRDGGFSIEKRSQMLGHLSEGKYVMAVAGTHGKTTTSTLVAWLNRALTGGGSAFLGGISKNFGGNLVLGDGPRLAVEADEFDRSFLRLHPDVAVVTSADADHLDIYGTHEALKEAFAQFVRQIRPGGALILKQGVEIVADNPGIAVYRYSYDEPCDFYARGVRLLEGGHYRYDVVTPSGVIEGCTLGVPGWVNIENSVAAVASVWCAAKAEGAEPDADALRGALASFSGVKRRITALFQPHLYTRTRDLYVEFAEALSHADEVVLLPIYPAREEPIEGVSSELIAGLVPVPCRIVERGRLADEVAAMPTDVVISFGAGNIDACCGALAERLRAKS